MPIIKPADFISLFGEKTLCNVPDYKRTGLYESEDGTIVKAVYTARIDTQNWKQKHKEELKDVFASFAEIGLVNSETSPVFTSSIEISMVADCGKFSLSASIQDYDVPDHPFTTICISWNRGDAGAIASQIAAAKNRLKSLNTPGRIARRMIDHIKGLYVQNFNVMIILEKLPFLKLTEGAVFAGKTLTMGRIPDNHNCARGEDIDWKVLHVDSENKRALVVSEKLLTTRQINAATPDSYVYRWSDCDINRWLNSDFISEYGLSHVPMVSVEHTTEQGGAEELKEETTNEKVFLLSFSEVQRYADIQNGGLLAYSLFGSSDNWWLRSPQQNAPSPHYPNLHYASCIDFLGRYHFSGAHVTCSLGVRPAFWLSLA